MCGSTESIPHCTCRVRPPYTTNASSPDVHLRRRLATLIRLCICAVLCLYTASSCTPQLHQRKPNGKERQFPRSCLRRNSLRKRVALYLSCASPHFSIYLPTTIRPARSHRPLFPLPTSSSVMPCHAMILCRAMPPAMLASTLLELRAPELQYFVQYQR